MKKTFKVILISMILTVFVSNFTLIEDHRGPITNEQHPGY